MSTSDRLTRVRVPGDKSISHRCLMLAPLAEGASRIGGLASGADVAATAAVMRALGATDAHVSAGGGVLEVSGPARLRAPDDILDCGNSGTSARLLIGLLAGQPLTARLTGDDSLRRRPMDRVVAPLREAGATIRELAGPGRLPLEVNGGALRSIEHSAERCPGAAGPDDPGRLLFGGVLGGARSSGWSGRGTEGGGCRAEPGTHGLLARTGRDGSGDGCARDGKRGGRAGGRAHRAPVEIESAPPSSGVDPHAAG
jgi:3-phosphoshikimate 1-carboxyvinyltransferase